MGNLNNPNNLSNLSNLTKFFFICCFFCFIFLLSSCGYQIKNIMNDGSRTSTALSSNINYRLTTYNNQTLDLSEYNDKNTILLFGQIYCGSCNEEAQTILHSLINQTVAPTNVHLVSILVGATTDEADWWKTYYQIPWPVVIDLDTSVLTSLCPKRVVPCIVIHKPSEGIVLRKIGSMSVSEIENISGSIN
ncbi:MAG: redoxin domain-containing protein [Oligoflexia bacterium]|nr:redoxin domain-containing protein [Oligoflexia bacterium]